MDMVIRCWDFGTKVWNSTSTFATSIIFLEKTVASLRTKNNRLIAKREDLKATVQVEEQNDRVMTKQFDEWMKRVEETDNKVNEVLAEHQDIGNRGVMFRFGSTFMLGFKSIELLDVIQELSSDPSCLELTIQRPLPAPTRKTEGWRVERMESHKFVGNIDSNVEKVLTCLKDENVGIIGLHGMGGIGKTTLLKIINNKLPQSGDDAFDCALFVKATANATIETIQHAVLGKLGMAPSDKSVEEVGTEISNALENRKYILMLDDVWKKIDLFKGVGIPHPRLNHNKSKIIFATRLEGVCAQMKAQPIIRVEGLSSEEAWSLFRENVGEATLRPNIESWAREVVEECDGLPLALISIGSTMSGKEMPCEWSRALKQLRQYPAKFPDLGEKVFPKLKLSYDYLADPNAKKCFLYCSLSPEDWEINSEDLVYLWMGEGYLNEEHDIKEARDYGYIIIEELKRVCLLESVDNGSDPSCEQVKMHDVMRDMALWIAKDFLVVDNLEIMRAKSNDQYWNRDVKKMSLWKLGTFSYKIMEGDLSKEDQEMLIPSGEYPNLSTLLIRIPLEASLWGLMSVIPNVRVLCFSGSYDLGELPEGVSKLENLEYLDISHTSIRRLPKEMKSLRKLRYLLMNFMIELEECPAEIISNFTELLVFHLDNSTSIEQLLRGLEKLQKIKSIKICLDSPETVNYLQKSKKLQSRTTSLTLKNMTGEELELSPTNMRILESLSIIGSNIKAIKSENPNKLMNFNVLRVLFVSKCSGLKELDMLAYAPSLEELQVEKCKSIERIIKKEEAKPVFLSLKVILLQELPRLENICNSPLALPSLESVDIKKCPNLKQNPFNDMNPATTKLRKIKGEREWWDSLNWRDDSLLPHFSPFFQERWTSDFMSESDEETDEE